MTNASAGQLPLCFVLMPFGLKSDASGSTVDFDRVYTDAIAPAVSAAKMEPLRADEERDGGIIHKPMFERLVLCAFAVADLTLANANVFYELGVRHSVRPHTTVLLFAKGGQRLPFDVAPLRALSYSVDSAGVLVDAASLRDSITSRLEGARDPATDSPLYQLLDGFGPPDIARLKTDVFRDRVRYSAEVKARLTAARAASNPKIAVLHEHENLKPLADKDPAIAVDLLLSYRAVSDFDGMLKVVGEMSPPVAASALVREQYALALNRLDRSSEAEGVLLSLMDDHGPSSETLGILGRVYKDRWDRAVAEGSAAAPGFLQKAIDTYRRGFESDWRDAYPGVNAVTLLELQKPGQDALRELHPVVRYAAERRVAKGGSDYWDRATLLELAVIGRDVDDVQRRLADALAEAAEPWQRETTARNLRLIADARDAAGEDASWLRELVAQLV